MFNISTLRKPACNGDCMWADRLVMVFHADGKLLQLYWTLTNQYGEYCGRELIVPDNL